MYRNGRLGLAMRTGSVWIIRVALAVQFLGAPGVPGIVLASSSPRALWMAEWLPALSAQPASRRESMGSRNIGVLALRESTLSFSQQGQVDWELELSNVSKVATVNRGRALLIVSARGDEYVVSIIGSDLTRAPAKRARATIEHALQLQAANGRSRGRL